MRFDRRSILVGGLAVAACSTLPGTEKSGSFLARNRIALGLQLYTLGALPVKDLSGTLAKVAAMGYREIELPGLLGFSPEAMRAATDAAGLAITSVHLPTRTFAPRDPLAFEGDMVNVAAAMRVLGTRYAVIAMPPMPKLVWGGGKNPQAVISDTIKSEGMAIWERTVMLLNQTGRALKAEGMALSYHNHNFEFATVGETTGFDYIVAKTDPSLVAFEIDIGWVAAAGLDPVNVLKRLNGRVRQLHLKDVKATTIPNTALDMDPIEVGLGKVDWRQVLKAARGAGAKHFYVEQEPPFVLDRLESVARSAAYLNALR